MEANISEAGVATLLASQSARLYNVSLGRRKKGKCLLDEDYAYLQEKYIAEESLRPVFGDSLNKRKPHNGKYEWENLNAD